jgi:uracil-DNA glycosylase
MSKESDEVRRQARQHLDNLRMAGIEWVPGGSHTPAKDPVSAAPTSLPLFPEESPPQPIPTFEERQQQLAELKERVSRCTRCPHLAATRTQTVFGVGPLDAELCMIGEAPGATEDARGEPFVGEAGQLLNRIIAAMGMRRQDIFICNIIRCRPPGNRLPNAEEASHCREYLEQTLALVRPRTICCLGACAAQNLLSSTEAIGRMRGRVLSYHGIPVFCTYHPAYLLRNPAEKKKVWEDMKKLLAHMGRVIPQH